MREGNCHSIKASFGRPFLTGGSGRAAWDLRPGSEIDACRSSFRLKASSGLQVLRAAGKDGVLLFYMKIKNGL